MASSFLDFWILGGPLDPRQPLSSRLSIWTEGGEFGDGGRGSLTPSEGTVWSLKQRLLLAAAGENAGNKMRILVEAREHGRKVKGEGYHWSAWMESAEEAHFESISEVGVRWYDERGTRR